MRHSNNESGFLRLCLLVDGCLPSSSRPSNNCVAQLTSIAVAPLSPQTWSRPLRDRKRVPCCQGSGAKISRGSVVSRRRSCVRAQRVSRNLEKDVVNQAAPSLTRNKEKRGEKKGNSKQGRKKEGEGKEAGRRILKKGNLHRTRDTPWGSETRVQKKKKKNAKKKKVQAWKVHRTNQVLFPCHSMSKKGEQKTGGRSTVRQAEKGRNACGVPFPIFSPLFFWWRGGLGLTGQDRGTAASFHCFLFLQHKKLFMRLVNNWITPFFTLKASIIYFLLF